MNEKIWEQFEWSQVDRLVKNMLGEGGNRFSDVVATVMQGEFEEAFSMLKKAVIDICVPGILESKSLFVGIVLLGLFAMLLHYTFGVVRSRQVTDMAYYFVYLLLVLLLLSAFGQIMETAGEVLSVCKQFVTALIPSYCLSVSLSSGSVSAAVNYEMILLLLLGTDYILAGLLLPVTQTYVFLAVMDGLDEKNRMKEFIRLVERMISWGIKLCLTITLMVSGVQNAVTIHLDGMQKTVFQKAVGALPGIGDMSEAVTEVLMGSAGLIRNSIGTVAMVFLFLVILRPLWKILCLSATMKLAGACVRFMGQNRLSDIVSKVGEGGILAMRTVMCAALSFCIVIAMTMFVMRGGA